MNPYLYCSGAFNSLNNDLIRRSVYGGNRPCWSLKNVVPDFLLETFECAREDRFMMYTEDLRDCPGYQIRFCPEDNWSHIGLLAKENGQVMLVDTNIVDSSAIFNSYKAHNNCIFDVLWLGRHKLLTCGGDSSVRQHDLETSTVISRFTSHTSTVKSLTLRPSYTSQFASGSRDGSVLLWDMRLAAKNRDNSGQESIGALTFIHNAHNPDLIPTVTLLNDTKSGRGAPTARRKKNPKAVTSVIFTNDNTIATSGCSDGKIKFWDVRKLSKESSAPLRTITHNNKGYTDLIVNGAGSKLFANCMDSFIYEYDLGSPNWETYKHRYTGHTTNSFYLKMDLSPDENYLICGSSSLSAYIYRLGLVPQRPVILNGHQGDVTVCRWCPSNQGIIVTMSDDCTAMIHRMRPGSQYNVFYRGLDRRGSTTTTTSTTNHHSEAPVALSSRVGEETVNSSNQRHEKPPMIVHSLPLVAATITATTATTATTIASFSTPKKLKNQSISTFMSPLSSAITPPPPPPPQRIFATEIHNGHILPPLTQTRSPCTSLSSLLTSTDSQKRPRPNHSPHTPINSHNKENIKRQKTVKGQCLITNFLKPEDES